MDNMNSIKKPVSAFERFEEIYGPRRFAMNVAEWDLLLYAYAAGFTAAVEQMLSKSNRS